MTKIIMLFWVLTDGGQITEPQRIEGFMSMEACQVAAESFTESNPRSEATHKYAKIAMCLEVPK